MSRHFVFLPRPSNRLRLEPDNSGHKRNDLAELHKSDALSASVTTFDCVTLSNHQIHLLGSAFCVRELDGARVVLRKGRGPYLWHIARGPVAAAVLAGMSAPVLAEGV